MNIKNDRTLLFKKKKKSKPWKDLWTTEQIANQNYTCDKCHTEISAGDCYRRTVMRTSLHGLYVEREHVEPDCPVDPLEEERRIHEEIIEEIEAETKKDEAA